MRVKHLIQALLKQDPEASVTVPYKTALKERLMLPPSVVTDAKNGNVEILPLVV